MKKLAIVIGTPSSGKTSLVDSVKNDRRYKIINLGDIMQDIAVREKYVKNRDKLRYLPMEKQEELRTKAVATVSRENGDVILDTHATVEQHGRFFPGLSFYMMTHLKHTVAIFYIDALTEHIIRRRKADKSRHREIEPEWLINTQRDINLAIASYYSTYLNIPLYLIVNEDGKLPSSIRDFRGKLEDAFGEK